MLATTNLKSGVYQIKNTVSGKVYIGSSADIATRWYFHRYHLKKGVHANRKLQRAYNKHGDVFEFSVLDNCDDCDLLPTEQQWLDRTEACKYGYNIVPIAGSTKGMKMSNETREKMKLVWARGTRGTRKGVPVSDETKDKLRAANLGKKLSPENIAKRTATTIANNALRPKRITSPETKAKQSAAASRRPKRHHTEEARANISAAATRRYNMIREALQCSGHTA